MRGTAVVVGVVAALVLGACADDADEASSSTTASTESTTASMSEASEASDGSEASGAEAPYPEHRSEQYAGTQNWICHPDLADDVCRDLTTTVIAPDGSRTVDELAPAEDPSFDCFYVYPTTSMDPPPNSDLSPDASETDTVRAQVARYASVCRVFAPVYRSVPLAGLGGGAGQDAFLLAYQDVVDAWRSYVTDQNDGRGVVLIGHSQGSGHLRRLVEEEIDGSPALRDLVVSVVLLGGAVPADGFEHIPPCESADDSGCVISYASYPADHPPAEGAIFGRLRDTGEPALCVDPEELLGGGDEPVGAVLPTQLSLLGGVQGFEDVRTPFVRLPHAVRTSCAETNGYGYLAVELAPAEGDVRDLSGLVEQRLGPSWGLHLLDANIGQDALIEVVARQAEAHAG
jgi:hypothetical protein